MKKNKTETTDVLENIIVFKDSKYQIVNKFDKNGTVIVNTTIRFLVKQSADATIQSVLNKLKEGKRIGNSKKSSLSVHTKIIQEGSVILNKKIKTYFKTRDNHAQFTFYQINATDKNIPVALVCEIYHPNSKSEQTETNHFTYTELINYIDETYTNKKIFDLYTKVKKSVKGYKKYLGYQKPVKTVQDIKISDKDSYFRQYPLEEKLYTEAELADFYMICTSSGSTGEPTIWPRSLEKDDNAEKGHTEFLNTHFNVLHKKTLLVIAFGLGTSTAGMLHARHSWKLNKQAKVSVLTPGTDIQHTAYMINALYKSYDQVVVLGYPPLISEMIDHSVSEKLPVKKWNLGLICAGGSANAKWRLTIADLIGDNLNTSLSRIVTAYGCTETGLVGYETPSITKLISKCILNVNLRKKIFNSTHLPTLISLNVPGKYVEIVNDELILSVDQPIPLLRYNLHDKVSYLSGDHIKKVLKEENISMELTDIDQNYLVIYGRNNNFFSAEEILFALSELNSDLLLENEFQYKEEKIGNQYKLTLHLYLKNEKNISKKTSNEYKTFLEKQLSEKGPCTISLTIKNESDRIGFKTGKLQYFLR